MIDARVLLPMLVEAMDLIDQIEYLPLEQEKKLTRAYHKIEEVADLLRDPSASVPTAHHDTPEQSLTG